MKVAWFDIEYQKYEISQKKIQIANKKSPIRDGSFEFDLRRQSRFS